MDVEELAKEHKKWSRRNTAWLFLGGVPTLALLAVTGELTPGGPPVSAMPPQRAYFQGLLIAFSFVVVVNGLLSLRRAKRARRALAAAVAAKAEKAQREPITDRIKQLMADLKDSQQVFDEVSAELRIRGEALERLAAEAAEKRNLAALHADEAAAVDALVNRRIQENINHLERGSLRQQWGFFLLSTVLLAIPLGVAGNFVFEWIK